MERRVVIPNFELTLKLGESCHSLVYKAYHKKNPLNPLVLKILKTGYLSAPQKLHFQQKIEQLKILNDPLLVPPLSFEAKDDWQFTTRQYFAGQPLNEWAKTKKEIHLGNFFTVSTLLSQALQKVHETGIIHGGIKPHNILIDPKNMEIRLVDFISFLDVREISHFLYDMSFVEDTLAYTSPEQTGRINHRVDFSSDLYSLGIVFYELLTGKLPFFSPDPLELIHSHLAEEAAAVNKINPQVPEMLGKIISKLLVKQPEKRYQSGAGLLADIVQCSNEYLSSKSVSQFPIARFDFTHRIIFVSKMVGRDKEAKTILDQYHETAGGTFQALLISGLPGIGKTRLIQELQRPIVVHRGYFVSGKFDLYQKNIPYSALLQSLRNLTRTFLTESDERVEHWKHIILKALGNNGKVLTDVIPELEILIGPQPPVPHLPPVESRNRFNDLFGKFLTSLASKENPLTIFIDDLQWCDSATFDFLENLSANYKEHKYLFFIGAYRYNEVDSRHTLSKLIRNFHDHKRPLKEILLHPLETKHCHEMVAYILDSTLFQTEELAAFITKLSEGNPLFVSEILSYLHNENLLFLDENRHWKWDLSKIRRSNMPSSVAALFSAKVQQLSRETIGLLEYCACMGNRFSPTEVSLIKKISLLDTFQILKSALAQGLLMESKDDLQFVHDRVQEAVLSKITVEERRKIHWEIGSRLLSAVPEGQGWEKMDNLFAIAAHLNLGRPAVVAKTIADQLSYINYLAGNKALESLAAEAANEYYNLARELLTENCWETNYDRAFEIYQKTAKTELMCGNHEKSEKLLNRLLENAKTNLDKADALAEQTTSLSSIGNFISAIETANRGLSYFGKSIPTDTASTEKRREELMNEIEAKNIDVWQTILNMPFTKERKSKIELAFYSELIPDLYMSGLVPQLYLSAVQSTQHCLAGGMDESVIYSFSIMGLYLGEKGEFEKAFKYEDLAHNLCEKYPNTFGATRGMNGIVWCNMHSRSHPREIADYCLKSIQCGKNCGDLYNAGLSYGPLMWNLQVQGTDFSRIDDYAQECLEFSQKYHLNFSVRLAEAMQAGWIEPMKKNPTVIRMEKKLETWKNDNHVASAGSYFVHLGIVNYYLGNYLKAERYLQNVHNYLTGLTDNVLKRQWHVFLALNALRLHENKIKYQKKEELQSYLQPLMSKIELWAGLGPLLKPYLSLLKAEIERITGNYREARNLYLDAITVAHTHNYTFLEGLANEFLGEVIEKELKSARKVTEIISTVRILFREAARLYKKCRAEKKELLLQEKHPEYFEDDTSTSAALPGEALTTFPNIDTNYLMKSCLIIPAEIGEDVLLHKIMNVVIESSGAQHGYLIMEENGKLYIRAESHITEKEVVRTLNIEMEKSKNICQAIVRYVYRTGETLILENALEKGEFTTNPEVQAMKLKSVLCLPVIKQNQLIGILYLENRLTEAIFTPERTELTKLFTAEAAISLENSRLVNKMKLAETALKDHREQLEEMVEKRTRQLRKTRESLLIAERLAVLGQLAGSISHEIRNPLNVISSSAYYLKMKLGNKDSKLKEHIEKIESEVKNSTVIIDSLLSLSGMKEPKKERLNLTAVLNEIITVSEIPLTVKINKEIPADNVYLSADKGQLFIVFSNLIKNAVEAMNKKGRLTIKVFLEKEKSVKISFKDTGTGIAAKNIDKMFQLFFTTKSRGIGFGLPICKMIIEKHKGTINIDSQPGEGTLVTITLPLPD